jgi:hypothetical protein
MSKPLLAFVLCFIFFSSDISENDGDDYKNFKIEEEMYKFKADTLPFSRNVLYQLCDIEDDDIQSLIQSEQNMVKL